MLSNEALRKVNIAHQLHKALRDVANDIQRGKYKLEAK